jgi:hypothetical protein
MIGGERPEIGHYACLGLGLSPFGLNFKLHKVYFALKVGPTLRYMHLLMGII